MKDTAQTLRKVKFIFMSCKKVKAKLVEAKDQDIATQMDCLYFASETLYHILSSFNISFTIYIKFEKFMEEGFGIVSSKKMIARIDDLIALLDETMQLFGSYRRKCL